MFVPIDFRAFELRSAAGFPVLWFLPFNPLLAACLCAAIPRSPHLSELHSNAKCSLGVNNPYGAPITFFPSSGRERYSLALYAPA